MTLQVGDTGNDVKEVKRILTEAGYFSGPDDDYFGEDLAAAVRAYQTAHGISVDGVVGPETWGNMHGDANYPNNSAGEGAPTPKSGSSSSGPRSINERYPYLSFLLDDPQVGPLLREADSTNMDPALFQSRLMQTDWWKRTSDQQRNYFSLKSGDPATFQRRINELKGKVAEIGGSLGYDQSVLDEGYLDYFANQALQFGLSDRQIQVMLAEEITPLIGATEKSNVLRDIRRVQSEYSYAIDGPTQQYWLREIGTGRLTIEQFENTVKAQMKAMFPNLANQFDSGMTFKQIIEPYRQVLSKEFDGANVEDFDFMGDPKWRHVVDYVDEKTGVHRTMSMQELTKYARSQAEWRNTKNAKDQVAEIGEQLLRSFGAVA